MSDDRYRPITPRRRLLIVVLALVTASTVLLSLIYRPGNVKPPPAAPAADVAPCVPGQTAACVGGKAEVILLPAAASAPV